MMMKQNPKNYKFQVKTKISVTHNLTKLIIEVRYKVFPDPPYEKFKITKSKEFQNFPKVSSEFQKWSRPKK